MIKTGVGCRSLWVSLPNSSTIRLLTVIAFVVGYRVNDLLAVERSPKIRNDAFCTENSAWLFLRFMVDEETDYDDLCEQLAFYPTELDQFRALPTVIFSRCRRRMVFGTMHPGELVNGLPHPLLSSTTDIERGRTSTILLLWSGPEDVAYFDGSTCTVITKATEQFIREWSGLVVKDSNDDQFRIGLMWWVLLVGNVVLLLLRFTNWRAK